ncbi:hypothetical protein HL658_18655 [Azospirillum sp. RWY-5-1]|uniref:Uncharacterized protein n=1 Tax=Azospirillum oleiclasticum TaxID=2735135 RepID=A0ABX2TM56_9PROT|nr:hypothetical protein [Azospirillum oleiclasticum]NYZ14575.1 hypothetical protein [Azospirillum oleiclasticum]NYZ24353.1 hypothetical protein [Azospirillum oleiclasticum]
MATNFHLIGVGGSGAKSVAAFVHCCAAGLAPPSVTVSLLDQDASNGNVSEASELISTYRSLYQRLGKNLPPSPERMTLFGSEIANPQNGTAPETPRVWLPLGATVTTMGEHFQYPRLRPEIKHLVSALLNQHEEIGLQLDRGFRGRPAVGAVVLSSLGASHPLLDYLDRIANDAGHQQRVFLAGSVFGGMGASGLPTVARTLRNLRSAPGRGGRRAAARNGSFNIGTALLLPYFEFPDPPSGTAAAEEIAVTSAQIPWSSRMALEYYHSQIDGDGGSDIFDHLYLVGQQPLTSVDYFSTGSRDQRNPALLPEMLAALAGCHFFAAESIPSGKIFRASHRDSQIGWEDLPRVWSVANAHEVRIGMAQLLRFAFAYRYAYFPCIHGDRSARTYGGFDWYAKLIGRRGLKGDDIDTAKELNRYCTLLLRWIADIFYSYKKMSTGGETALGLFDVSRFSVDPRVRTRTAAGTAAINDVALMGDHPRSAATRDREPAAVKDEDVPGLAEAFTELVGDEGKGGALDLLYIYDALERSRPRASPGLTAFVDALWRACATIPAADAPKLPPWWQSA